MAPRCRIWAASTTWRACRRESARHPSCCYRSREIHACEFAGCVIATFTRDNVFCHSLKLSKEVVSFTEVIYSVGKVWLHVLTGEVREVFRDCTAGWCYLPYCVYKKHPRAVSLLAWHESSREDHARWYHDARRAVRMPARNLGHTVSM